MGGLRLHRICSWPRGSAKYWLLVVALGHNKLWVASGCTGSVAGLEGQPNIGWPRGSAKYWLLVVALGHNKLWVTSGCKDMWLAQMVSQIMVADSEGQQKFADQEM